jgi:hypothetical protein
LIIYNDEPPFAEAKNDSCKQNVVLPDFGDPITAIMEPRGIDKGNRFSFIDSFCGTFSSDALKKAP